MRFKMFFSAAVLFSALCLCAQDGEGREQVLYLKPQPGQNVSQVKAQYIRKQILSFVKYKDDISDPSIIKEIHALIAKNMPLDSTVPADQRTRAMIYAEAVAAVRKKYPVSDKEYRAKLEKEAQEKFRLYKHGEIVQIRYHAGSKIKSVKGRYGQFNGRGVTINFKSIPYYDIISDDKAHVNPEYSAAMRKKFIEDGVARYRAEKLNETHIFVAQLTKKIEDTNLQNGYIKVGERWVSPREFANSFIEEQIKLHPELVRAKGNAGDSVLVSTDGVNRQLLKKKVEKMRGIFASQTKVDADSGCFDVVYWGFTRAEVKASIRDLSMNLSSAKDHDVVFPSDRQIEKVLLFYDNDRLVRAEVIYSVNDINVLVRLKKSLTEKYGLDDMAKQGKGTAPRGSIAWTGKTTKAVLKVTIGGDDKISEVRLIREPHVPAQFTGASAGGQPGAAK